MTDDAAAPVPTGSTDAFADLDAYVALPRLSGLALAPDGKRLVVGVARLSADRKEYVTSLWSVDTAVDGEGERPAARLTRSAEGESGAAFTPDGDLLFVSARPRPDDDKPGDDKPKPALWLLPAAGGEARVVATRPGGVTGIVTAERAPVVLVGSATLPGATDAGDDEQRRKARKDAAVSGILHTGYPVRFWDHDLGPDKPRLLAATLETGSDERVELRDLTGDAGAALDEASWHVAPDGRTAVTTWAVTDPGAAQRPTIVAVDLETGERRALLDDPAYEFGEPRVSPDGTQVVALRERISTPKEPIDLDLVVVPLTGGEPRVVTADWDRWPSTARWTADGAALVVVADEDGRSPLFLLDVTTGDVRRLTPDDAAYTDPVVSPDGRWVYALRSAVDAPPAPVRVSLDADRPEVTPLRGPAAALDAEPALPGRVEEVRTTAPDGTPLRAWLALPHDASADRRAPLLLWIHGGPLHSWNSWSWRWNPWLMVAQGYAVLLPDPALSTGYGLEFIRRGWGQWGGAPYDDLMTLTDAALERDDLDAERTAAMGGSFGGYMANWVAGHTDRFRAIVTHASLWALDQFGPTTDAGYYWHREMTTAMAEANSPHRSVDEIRTPMLVVHGDRDYRVPIGEALRLWYDLSVRAPADGSSPHRFLYFPDENHWVLGPGNAKVWYETALAFLAVHVLGEEERVPDLLR